MIATKPSDLRWLAGPLPEPTPNLVVFAWVEGELVNGVYKAFCSTMRGGRTWAFADHQPLERVGVVVWYAVVRDEPQLEHVPLERRDDEVSIRELVAKVAEDGGCVVSVADCNEGEISAARERGDYAHDWRGERRFVRRLPTWLQQHSPFARGAAAEGCGR